MALGFGLALAVAVLGSLTEGHSRETFVILPACIFALTIAEYLLDSPAYDWIDPYVALSWLALGICLASSRLMGTLSGPARMCIGIGLAIKTAELLRSAIAVTIYGDAAQPPLSQWFESESDLLLHAAYLIGVFELCYSKAMAHPASAGAGDASSLWSLMAGIRRQKGRIRFKALYPEVGPGGYYASKVIRRLDDGHGHPTLGNRSFSIKLPFRRSPRRADEFSREGLEHFNFALRAGLRPNHVCVDYGCRSLRVGQHLIRYLKAGNYWGLDVVDRFFRDGFDLLPQESRTKSPRASRHRCRDSGRDGESAPGLRGLLCGADACGA